MCGDFNSLPDSSVYQFISKGVITQQHPDLVKLWNKEHSPQTYSSPLKLSSAYGHNHPNGEPLFTNHALSFKGTLDYIFYSNELLNLKELLDLPSEDQVTIETSLPNSQFSSDHLSIKATFELL